MKTALNIIIALILFLIWDNLDYNSTAPASECSLTNTFLALPFLITAGYARFRKQL